MRNLREVQIRILAKLTSLLVVSLCCVCGVVKSPEIKPFASNHYSRHPFASGFVPTDSLEFTLLGSRVLSVKNVVNDSQIRPSIVELVSVDMVNLEVSFENQTVHIKSDSVSIFHSIAVMSERPCMLRNSFKIFIINECEGSAFRERYLHGLDLYRKVIA